MKRFIKISVVAVAVLSISALACADDVLKREDVPVAVTLDVAEVFGFRIGADQYNQSLYPNSDDATKHYGYLHIAVSTNKGSSWAIQAECDGIYKEGQTGLDATSVPLVISTYPTRGNPLQGVTVANMELIDTPQPIYTSSLNEVFIKDLLVYTRFNVKEDALPLGQGIYRGSIMLTMTGAPAPL